jgi:hypothetical protein
VPGRWPITAARVGALLLSLPGLFRSCGLPGLSSAVLDVGAAIGAIHLGKGPVRPPSIKGEHALLGLLLAGVMGGNIGQVDRQNVGNQDFGGLTAADPAGLDGSGSLLSAAS